MNEKPLVSIIIPTYNSEKFISETIKSALNQTYKNLEVIVGDDGSTDRTSEIVKQLQEQDSRVRYVYQKNAGQSAARNAAIAKAQGKYISFLDADDLFLPTKLEEQVRQLEQNPDCGVSYCKIHHFFDSDPKKIYYFPVPHPSGFLFKDLLKSSFINPLTVVLRKELLDKYGAFEPSFRRVDEQYLWLKLAYHKTKFCYLDKVLGHYRVHQKSLSNEAVYFKETEEKYLELLNIVRSWMSQEEIRQYDFEAMVRRTRKRLLIGKIMAGQNPFSKLLFMVYTARRNKRLVPVSGL